MSNSYLACNNTVRKVSSTSKRYDTSEYQQNILAYNVIGNTISFSNGNFKIIPTSNYYIISIKVDNTYSDVDVFFDVDVSSSNIGDQVVLIIKTMSYENNAYINFSDNFYYTGCGGTANSENVNERIALNFIFDGEKFVNTNDNC